jgi:cell division septum initiation protein DivIVA
MDKPSMTASEEIACPPFSGAFRGFDKNEVRTFLAELSRHHKALVDRASEAETRLDDLKNRLESVEELLQSADEKYQAAQARLEEMEQERPVAVPPPEPDPEQDAVKVFGEKVTEVLQIAVAAGNSIRAEAETWASQRRLEADRLAADTLASARQEVAEIVAHEETNVEQLRTTEQGLRNWLRAAHAAIGQVLEQPVVEPGALAAVLGKVRGELGPAEETVELDEVDEDIEAWEPVPIDEGQSFIPMPTVLTSYLG